MLDQFLQPLLLQLRGDLKNPPFWIVLSIEEDLN